MSTHTFEHPYTDVFVCSCGGSFRIPHGCGVLHIYVEDGHPCVRAGDMLLHTCETT